MVRLQPRFLINFSFTRFFFPHVYIYKGINKTNLNKCKNDKKINIIYIYFIS